MMVSWAALGVVIYPVVAKFLGLSTTAILGVSLFGIGIALLIAGLAVMVVIQEEGKKAAIKEWLARCIFGTGVAEDGKTQLNKYQAPAAEDAALKAIFS
jgi:hypothetical protein